jgi:hypothetical protein
MEFTMNDGVGNAMRWANWRRGTMGRDAEEVLGMG